MNLQSNNACNQITKRSSHVNGFFFRFFSWLGQSPWSMAMCLVWQSVLLGNGWNWSLFLLGDVQLIGGGGQLFKINILAVKHLIINIMAWVPRKKKKPASLFARKRLEKNILTRHKLPGPPPPAPAESNGRPLNFIVNVCFVCRIWLGCFAWRTGWICSPLIQQTDALTICTMSSIFDWKVRRLGMRDTLKHGTITVSGFGKNYVFCGEKMFQRQI